MSDARAPRQATANGEPPLVLTPRGRRVLLVLLLVVITLVALTCRALFAEATPVSRTPSTSVTTPASPAAKTSPTPSATPSPTPSVSSTKGGIPQSGLVGTGKFTTSNVALPAAKKTSTLHTFVVKIEGGVTLDPNAIARQIHATLNDKRGWLDYKGASFAAVSDAADADLIIHLASPPTVNRMCAPLKVGGKWSCASRNKVILNSDRWQLLTPTYTNAADYRAYMVNHEVGHYLGRGHVGCPKPGAPAPVMLQQSISLEGCRANVWPRTSTGQP